MFFLGGTGNDGGISRFLDTLAAAMRIGAAEENLPLPSVPISIAAGDVFSNHFSYDWLIELTESTFHPAGPPLPHGLLQAARQADERGNPEFERKLAL